MLEALCGNRSIQKILVFLFVNGKCYGTQLHRALKTPLTPIQKALQRLEKGGIIVSYYEGKTRVYQFNPAHPLFSEIELLLKKTYTLLPPNEKKDYYIAKDCYTIDPANPKSKMQTLLAFWDKLSTVKALTFNAKSRSKENSGWNGKGTGDVSIDREGPNIMLFNERGSWQAKQGSEMVFSNTFRWTLDRRSSMISLEHLRRGPSHPVLLFHLAPTGNNSLSSVDSYLCGGDVYFGQIHFDRYSLRLNWRVIGPKKNEEIDYYYA